MGKGCPISRKGENFDSIRLAAALIVAIGHMSALSGAFPVVNIFARPEGSTAVDIFFCVSGYLVTDSWLRQPSFRLYATKRALRIFPAVTAYALVMVFIIGPALAQQGVGRYFANHKSWAYLLIVGLYGAGAGLPGVFPHNPYSGLVNASLWTLPVEFACYLLVPLLGIAGRGFGIALLVLITLGCGGWAEVQFQQQHALTPIVYGGVNVPFAAMDLAYFCAASLLRTLAVRRPGLVRLDVALVLCVLCFGVNETAEIAVRPVTWVALPYLVAAFGEASTPIFRRAGRFGDLSYGLYLWHFPIMQIAIQLAGQDMRPIFWPLTVLASLAAAWLSWHVVEAPALGLKTRLPWMRAHERSPRAMEARAGGHAEGQAFERAL